MTPITNFPTIKSGLEYLRDNAALKLSQLQVSKQNISFSWEVSFQDVIQATENQWKKRTIITGSVGAAITFGASVFLYQTRRYLLSVPLLFLGGALIVVAFHTHTVRKRFSEINAILNNFLEITWMGLEGLKKNSETTKNKITALQEGETPLWLFKFLRINHLFSQTTIPTDAFCSKRYTNAAYQDLYESINYCTLYLDPQLDDSLKKKLFFSIKNALFEHCDKWKKNSLTEESKEHLVLMAIDLFKGKSNESQPESIKQLFDNQSVINNPPIKINHYLEYFTLDDAMGAAKNILNILPE